MYVNFGQPLNIHRLSSVQVCKTKYMDQIKQYIEEHKQRFLDELFELIRIPSVSAMPEHKPDMISMANLIRDKLRQAGADESVVMETKGQPVVFGYDGCSP